MEWRDEVELLYNITHSPAYRHTMESVEALSHHADQIARALPLMGLGLYADHLRRVREAATLMRQVYNTSETLHNAMQTAEVTPAYIQCGIVSGLLLITIGVIIRAWARRKGHVRLDAAPKSLL